MMFLSDMQSNQLFILTFNLRSLTDPPLWTLPWDSSLYARGKHHITVIVYEPHGLVLRRINQVFSLDGRVQFIGYNLIRLWAQVSIWDAIYFSLVAMIVVLFLLLLIIPKLWKLLLIFLDRKRDWEKRMEAIFEYDDWVFDKIKYRQPVSYSIDTSYLSNRLLVICSLGNLRDLFGDMEKSPGNIGYLYSLDTFGGLLFQW